MENSIIERADKDDCETLNKISVEAKMHWNYPEEWMKMWLKDILISPEYIENNHVYKIHSENEIAGFIAIEEGHEVFEIVHLWIRPQFIGKGFGKKLLNEVIAIVICNDAEILVESDPNCREILYQPGL